MTNKQKWQAALCCLPFCHKREHNETNIQIPKNARIKSKGTFGDKRNIINNYYYFAIKNYGFQRASKTH